MPAPGLQKNPSLSSSAWALLRWPPSASSGHQDPALDLQLHKSWDSPCTPSSSLSHCFVALPTRLSGLLQSQSCLAICRPFHPPRVTDHRPTRANHLPLTSGPAFTRPPSQVPGQAILVPSDPRSPGPSRDFPLQHSTQTHHGFLIYQLTRKQPIHDLQSADLDQSYKVMQGQNKATIAKGICQP